MTAKLPKLREIDIQRACEDLLQIDGWRIFRLEQNYSERKRKVIGEAGAPDGMYVRYGGSGAAEVLFIEWKRPGGKPSPYQLAWHRDERRRGAHTMIAGVDFDATVDGFMRWYRGSGFNRGQV